MDAPDEMVEAVARIAPEPNGNGEHLVEMLIGGHRHCAWLSGSPRLITALAEVIARDAKVREIVERQFDPAVDLETSRYRTVADLYLEDKRSE